MADNQDNRDLDLRTTPHSYRRRSVWMVVTILVILLVLGYGWIKVRDAVLVMPTTTNKTASAPAPNALPATSDR